MIKSTQDYIEIDKKHIWHPYASCKSSIDPILIEKAEGVWLQTADGEKLMDAMSSWWSVIHGYNCKELNEAIENQLKSMSHVMFGGLTHKPAIELTDLLLSIVPKNLQHVFYCDSGSVAVEVAMKMALQYWQGINKNKTDFLTIKKGYHGDTWHAMSVCDPVNGMHHIFNAGLSKYFFAEAPESKFSKEYKPKDIASIKHQIEQNHQTLCAVILEPIVQGAGGMHFYHPEYLKAVSELCKQYNILLICDEIATGFGRTGKLFAVEHSNIEPDIMCLGKAITGGYMSFAATLCTAKIAQAISENEPKVFMHGPTFMGNPLACSVAIASIKKLQSYDWKLKIKTIEQNLNKGLEILKHHSAVADVRVLGAIGVVEMKENVDMQKCKEVFCKHKIWIRPFGKLIYTMPQFIISDKELHHLTSGIVKSIYEIYGH